MSKEHLLTFFAIITSFNGVSNRNCTCMPYYQCSKNTEKVLIDGNDLLDVRGFKNQCAGYFDVCCDISERPNLNKGCGYRKPNDYPWLANLYFQRDIATKPIARCGASFIHKQAVLTAAHCLDQDGLWTIQKDDITVHIKKIIKHPKFHPGTLHNDIAIAILDSSATPNQLICVPPPGFIPKHTHCLVSSFDEPNSVEEGVKVVQLIDLPIVEREKCMESLRQTHLGEFFQLHYSFICAGGKDNKDTCNGDGGNPLVCPISDQPGRYHQVGIVSWGIGCGEFNTPGVYVNVAIFRDFIDEVMSENGLDISDYRY